MPTLEPVVATVSWHTDMYGSLDLLYIRVSLGRETRCLVFWTCSVRNPTHRTTVHPEPASPLHNRLKEDLDSTTSHLLYLSLGNFICRQVRSSVCRQVRSTCLCVILRGRQKFLPVSYTNTTCHHLVQRKVLLWRTSVKKTKWNL